MAENPIALRWPMRLVAKVPLKLMEVAAGCLGLVSGVVYGNAALQDMAVYHRLTPYVTYLKERWVEDLPPEQVSFRNQAIAGIFTGDPEAVKVAEYYRKEQIAYVNRYGNNAYDDLMKVSSDMPKKGFLSLILFGSGGAIVYRGLRYARTS